MTCAHCSEEICDDCWKKRADILRERDELRAEVKRLRAALEPFAKAQRRAAQRDVEAPGRLNWPGDFVSREEFALADSVSALKKPAVQP